ncbi:efflux RND transporter permease subunit [Desulfuromonas sp. KJ2020]|uniref:efflux RND transporter permease subunit n=1 Tax=Desulfuromonas sp. KJ2020 TaxID=2919173 RepID=UPI0020A71A29|nr:efflux RND transporter permease subunit [Desulfuromonas sp. KJ2020]MCP3176136.1 efflux RND transporter permease subunit [Desulfuromonas sp. KJ2020]
MSLPRFALKQPHLVAALAMVVFALGGFAFWKTPTDLFPDTVPPQVAVVTVKPGAVARDMADQVTQILEKELHTLSGVTRVSSTSRDEVSSINVEFAYDKSIGEAVTDVQNAVARVQGSLPAGAAQPRLFRITDANRPLLTLALSPRPDSLKTLADVRLLAENDLKDSLLRLDGIGDVQIFGGHRAEVSVRLDREALRAHGLGLEAVMAALAGQNVSAPAGIIYGDHREYLVNVAGEFPSAAALKNLPLRSAQGRSVYLRDVAEVRLETADTRSLYHGNGKAAIALNLLRPEKGETVKAIKNLKAALPGLEARYPDLLFEITDDQQPLIDLNVSGMRSSLVQAVILTVLVIFFFLGNLRAAATVSVSIPLSFLGALVVLWFSPYTLNMVTLSALIIAVGMVVDASVVVLENIYRRHHDLAGEDPAQAALEGTRQVSLAVTAGMLTTVVVLVPVIFTQGYTGRVMAPLNIIIIATLVTSLLVSLTVIPLVASRLLGGQRPQRRGLERLANPVEKGLDRLSDFYVGLVGLVLRRRLLFIILALVFLVFTLRVVRPLLGGEQMPPMDTGIALVEFDTDASASPRQVEEVLSRVEALIGQSPEVKSISAVVGSEPQAVSFGGGGTTTQSAKLTIHLISRTEREADIWQIQERWRQGLRRIEGVRTFRVSEYGATPVATTKAPFNLMITGPELPMLDSLADEALQRLRGLPGLTDLRRSWYRDKVQQTVAVDAELARLYGTSAGGVAESLRQAVQGTAGSELRLQGYLDIPIRLRYQQSQIDNPEALLQVDIPTAQGPIKLGTLAQVRSEVQPPFITRENLSPTIDLTAGNQVLTIAQVTSLAAQRLRDMPLPAGYALEIAGTARDMGQSQGEMGRALLIGLVLLFILLFAMFRSFLPPLAIVLSIPLAVAGAVWGLLLFDKPFCMPALMGIILLGGTIVNNAILMLDFILEARREGMSRDEAIIASVRLRLRPIFMTATSTVIGFSPLIFEMAVGLERMSPLGIAAASGLLVGTVVTMVYLPLVYVLLDDAQEKLRTLGRAARKAVTSLLLLGVLLSPQVDPASAAELPSPLSLTEAVAYGLEHSPALAQAAAEVERGQGLVRSAEAPRGVQLRLEGSAAWSQERHNMAPGLAPQNQGFAHRVYQATASADLLLADFGATRARLKAARAAQEGVRHQAARARDEVAFQISQQFLQVLSLGDIRRATFASLDSLSALDRAAEQLWRQGRTARVDKLKVEVRLAEVESQLAEVEAALVEAEYALLALLGCEGELPPLTEVDPGAVTQTSAENRDGVSPRDDLAARQAEVESARRQLAGAKRAYLPELRLFASAGYYGADDPQSMAAGIPGDDSQTDATVGVKLTVPLLDGGLRAGQVAQARAEADRARARLREAQLNARRELAVAQAEVASAQARQQAHGKGVVQAREAVRLERLKYEAQKGSVNEVLDAEAALLQARSLLRQAERGLILASLAEELARGRLSFPGE